MGLRTGTSLLLSLLVLASGVQAAPCTGALMDVPLPGAQAVETRFADTPTARALRLWQEGQRNGLRYLLSADMTARITPTPGERDWVLVLHCAPDGMDCRRNQVGLPPASARVLATVLERCLAGEPLEVAAPPPVIEAQPCRVETVEIGPTPAHTLQRLLIARGAAIGRVDGLIGPRTLAALDQAMPDRGSEPLDVAGAIDVLNAQLCGIE